MPHSGVLRQFEGYNGDALHHAGLLCEQTKPRPEQQLKAWLFAVCRNRIIDDVRKQNKMATLEPGQMELTVGKATNPSSDVEQKEYLMAIQHHVQQLPPDDREIVDLWSHGLRHKQIAEITSQKPGTVRVQLHRALRTLKQRLNHEQPNPSPVQR